MEQRRQDQDRFTAEDLLRIKPEEDDHHYELDEGELILVAPTGAWHGSIEARVVRRLGAHVEAGRLGEVVCGDVGFRLGEHTVRAPDVAFLSRERLRETPLSPEGIHEGFYLGPPDLAVEVLSPGDAAGEVLRKAGRFIEAGCALVWIVDPRRRIVTIYRRDAPVSLVGPDGILEGEDVVPGFRCRVAEFFPEEED